MKMRPALKQSILSGCALLLVTTARAQGKPNEVQILNRILDYGRGALRVSAVAQNANQASAPVFLNADQIYSLAYDPANNAIKVSIVSGVNSGTGGIASLNGLTAGNQTFATSGTCVDFSITSAESTHTVCIPTASASARGLLSPADWSSFNSKENGLTFNGPLTRSANTISIPAAGSGQSGYLTSADWNAFSNKVAPTRTLSTAFPLTGGGDLSADRTISCPACELNINKNSANGYAGLDSSGRLAKAQTPPSTVYTDQANTWTSGTQQFNSEVLFKAGTPWLDARAFGARGDLQHSSSYNVSITSGSTTLACPSCAFSASDVGKVLIVEKGASGGVSPLITTIASVTDSTHLVMTDPAGNTNTGRYCYWATDDSAALQSWLNALALTGGVGHLGKGTYLVRSGLTLTAQTAWHLFGDGANSWGSFADESGTRIYTADPITILTAGQSGNTNWAGFVLERITFRDISGSGQALGAVKFLQTDHGRISECGFENFSGTTTGPAGNTVLAYGVRFEPGTDWSVNNMIVNSTFRNNGISIDASSPRQDGPIVVGGDIEVANTINNGMTCVGIWSSTSLRVLGTHIDVRGAKDGTPCEGIRLVGDVSNIQARMESNITGVKATGIHFLGGKQGTQTISSITRDSTGKYVTVTINNHALVAGQTVTISGVTPASFNGPFFITTATANTFTYDQPGTPNETGTGGTATGSPNVNNYVKINAASFNVAVLLDSYANSNYIEIVGSGNNTLYTDNGQLNRILTPAELKWTTGPSTSLASLGIVTVTQPGQTYGSPRFYSSSGLGGLFFNDTTSPGGLWFTGDQASRGFIGAGLYGNGTTKTAASTSASFASFNGSTVEFYADSGLTAGNTFTPTKRAEIASTAANFRRLRASLGTPLASGDWAMSAGWGTGATLSVAAGSTDQRGQVTVTAGTAPVANPTLTLTFHDGSWPAVPFVLAGRNDAASPAAQITWTTTATTLVLTFQGIPVAGQSYTINWVLIG